MIQRKEAAQRERKSGLPGNLRAGLENLSGLSMDNVNVHYNSPEPARLQALAYTKGTDIHLAPGQEQNLPHEAWHVVQQKQGRVVPTMQLKGERVNDSSGLEREADVMGAKASGGASAGSVKQGRRVLGAGAGRPCGQRRSAAAPES
ncbi:MAG: eCIS core domain-containing protein [Gammaproteobacteria bacterium]